MNNNLDDQPVWVWGLPLAPYSVATAIEAIDGLVERRQPAFFITANTHYAMLTWEQPELRDVNTRAAFLLADGAPLVWASRRGAVRLPERVAGSDLIYGLGELAARKGYRLFLAGGAPGVAERAALRLTARYPGLPIAGTAAPRFRDVRDAEYDHFKNQIAQARPDILIVAATMPQGERWLSRHLADLGVPLGVNLGASIDFVAGRVSRAPRWMRKSGLEWAFRLMLEPRRLFGRYARNAWFVLKMIVRDRAPSPGHPPESSAPTADRPTTQRVPQ